MGSECHKGTFPPQGQGPLCLTLNINRSSAADSVALCAKQALDAKEVY